MTQGRGKRSTNVANCALGSKHRTFCKSGYKHSSRMPTREMMRIRIVLQHTGNRFARVMHKLWSIDGVVVVFEAKPLAGTPDSIILPAIVSHFIVFCDLCVDAR